MVLNGFLLFGMNLPSADTKQCKRSEACKQVQLIYKSQQLNVVCFEHQSHYAFFLDIVLLKKLSLVCDVSNQKG
jgi:hypothetical protein